MFKDNPHPTPPHLPFTLEIPIEDRSDITFEDRLVALDALHRTRGAVINNYVYWHHGDHCDTTIALREHAGVAVSAVMYVFTAHLPRHDVDLTDLKQQLCALAAPLIVRYGAAPQVTPYGATKFRAIVRAEGMQPLEFCLNRDDSVSLVNTRDHPELTIKAWNLPSKVA